MGGGTAKRLTPTPVGERQAKATLEARGYYWGTQRACRGFWHDDGMGFSAYFRDGARSFAAECRIEPVVSE